MSLPPRPIPTLRQSLGARSGLTGLTRRLLVAVDRYVAGLQPRQLAGLLTLFASFFVVVATASFSALALDGLGKDRQRLDAVASLKAREIETWLDERHSDIGLLARNSVFQALLLPLQRRTDARWPDRLNAWYENLRLTTWLADMCRIHGFRSAEVVDRQGHPLVTSGSPPYQAGNLAELLALVSAARPLGELDLRRGEDGRTFLTFGAHVQATPQHEPLVLVFALDVAESLLPRVETWSHADHSGELLLLRISGGQAEQVKGEPVAQLVAGPDALDDPRSPLAQALRVGGGVFRGPDRQGQVHEAAVRAVQGRPWWIMARIDRDELLAPIVRLAWVGTLLTALGLTGVSALALLLWRQQRARLAEASHLAAELRRSSETALQATRAKTAFLATMSHEIRTPLNAVIGLTHLLRRRSPDGGWQADKLDQVSDAAQHLLAIVNDVLDISRVEAGRLTLEPREFLLEELVRSKVIALVSERAREKGLALIVDIEPALQLPLRGDPLRLAQALLNYVANAVKFTATGQVRLLARRVEAADPLTDAWLVRFEV
ncbi:MAG: hypothetical protein RL722_2784, partial [Pseudomonadota bacterium]